MFDYTFGVNNTVRNTPAVGGSIGFWIAKRAFDIGLSLALMPALIVASMILMLANPFRNHGPLFYIQSRMGKNCQPFRAIKFRSMVPAAEIFRGPDDPIEASRITRLGRFLRQTRIDELPQILNVLIGDMSLIGPRPDYFAHATVYLATVPGYRDRHMIRPGISGFAQINVGYVSCTEGTKSKTQADIYYINNASFALDTKIVFKTIYTVLARHGK